MCPHGYHHSGSMATPYSLYMGIYYTSVKRTQQLSGVTRIRTHDLLIWYPYRDSKVYMIELN